MALTLKLRPLFLLASILIQFADPSLSLPNATSKEVKATENDYMKWVQHMGFVRSYKMNYSQKLHKAVKEKENEKEKKETKKTKKMLKKKYKKQKKNPCKKTIKVNKNGAKAGDFISVQEAINSLPLINTCRVVISIGAGTYKEKVEIPARMGYVTVEGEGAEKTVIEWNDTAVTVGPSGQPLGTFASATFAVNSPNFIAKNITFKNTAGGSRKQAVAIRVSGDKAALIGCRFIGEQDTLYDHAGRHYFKDCYVEGSVDFVFGNGLSLYEGCHLHAAASFGAVTAQKRGGLLDQTGFSFVGCRVTGSGALYLGRAWGPFSRVVFAYTYMDDIIIPTGWYDWGDRSRRMTVFFGQYKCSGPGSEYGARVAWSRELTTTQAAPFISLDFIDGYGWLKKLD
ncbi:hypothetical protein V2J09_016427 [Rumex salicifolius]